jgi:para-nitrobenzyl esterase
VTRYKLTSYLLLICLILIGFSILAGCTQKGPDTTIVKTDAGYISGINDDENGLRIYLGVPYASPPTGDLRWRPTVPMQPWTGTRNASEFSAFCPQPPHSDTSGDGMSEDCLYLNVWTPAKSADEKLPVMVFIHGGAFAEGTGSYPLFNGSALARKGVVVVTFNYRLGALGFLAHPQLDNESINNTSGNYGILDQQAALNWVQKNIGNFGGEPSRVTIFGQSAGGSSILVHLVSPQSKGLYQQAIVQSGPIWTNGTILNIYSSKADVERYGEEYAKSFGYEGPDAITQMRKLSAGDLVNNTPWPASAFWRIHTLRFKPAIDGWIIPDSPDNMFLQHRENPVPLIVGCNANDGITLTANANMSVPEYQAFIRNVFGKNADAVLATYPAGTPDEVQLQLNHLMTDYDFKDSAKFAAGSMADIHPSTYLYLYSYELPNQPYGALHSSELFMVFRPPGTYPDPTSTRVSANMMDLWTRFAKTGDPNGGLNVTWPKYTREHGQYLDIGDTLTVRSITDYRKP